VSLCSAIEGERSELLERLSCEPMVNTAWY
jgi:hypothetical protein